MEPGTTPGHEEEAGPEVNVLDDVDLLVLQVGTESARMAGKRIKAYIILVTLLMIVFFIMWLIK